MSVANLNRYDRAAVEVFAARVLCLALPLLERHEFATVQDNDSYVPAKARFYREYRPESERMSAIELPAPRLSSTLAGATIARPRLLLGMLLVSLSLTLPGLGLLEFDASTERIFPEGHPAVANFQELRRDFGNDEFFILAYEAAGTVLERGELQRIQKLASRLRAFEVSVNAEKSALRPLRAVRAITELKALEIDPATMQPNLRPIFPENLSEASHSELDRARMRLLADEFGAALVTKDQRCVAMILELDRPSGLDEREQASLGEATVRGLRRIVREELTAFGMRAHVGGAPTVKADIVKALEADLTRFTTPLILISALAAFATFRRIRGVLLPLLVIGITSGLLFGTMGLFGFRLTPMTTLLSPLMFVVGIADSIHVLVELEGLTHPPGTDEGRRQMRAALAHVLPPCFVTSLTTTLGFGSLGMSNIAPVRDFGLLAALGTSVAFFVTFAFIPSIWILLPPLKARQPGSEDLSVPRLARWLTRAATPLALMSLVVFVIGAAALRHRSFDTDYVGFFRPGSPIHEAVEFIQPRFGGVASLEVVISGESHALSRRESLLKILAFEDSLRGRESVDATYSLASTSAASFKQITGQRIIPPQALLDRFIAQARANAIDSIELSRTLRPDDGALRVSARIRTMGSEKLAGLLREIRADAAERFPPESRLRVCVTGTPVIFSDSADAMLWGQIESFAWALGTITLVMIISLGSIRLGLLSLIPNIFPIIVTFGVMSLVGIPINSFNSMVASVAIGIAVDDTIHLLLRYQQLRRSIPGPTALESTIAHTGAAVLVTSLLLASGFAVLWFGVFKPTAHFGILTSLAVVTALWGDLGILPWLLQVEDRIWGRRVQDATESRRGELDLGR